MKLGYAVNYVEFTAIHHFGFTVVRPWTLRGSWLEDRNVNITSQFVRAFKVFEDFRFISQLKEEMEKVKVEYSISLIS